MLWLLLIAMSRIIDNKNGALIVDNMEVEQIKRVKTKDGTYRLVLQKEPGGLNSRLKVGIYEGCSVWFTNWQTSRPGNV